MNNELNKPILKPKDKHGLVDCIKDEIKEHGNECNLNYIDTSLITDMSYLFSNDEFEGFEFHDFNGDISLWNTSSVEDMSYMFYKSKFNNDISKWDTSNVDNMSYLFYQSQFNQDISSWNTSNVYTMKYLFSDSKFNQDISLWNTENVKTMVAMFYSSMFNQDISRWNISNVIDIGSMFENSKITKIPQWDYFKIDNIKDCFDNCSELIEPLPDWYQFNHIDNGQNRKKTYNYYSKSKKLNNSISSNLSIRNKIVNKI